MRSGRIQGGDRLGLGGGDQCFPQGEVWQVHLLDVSEALSMLGGAVAQEDLGNT